MVKSKEPIVWLPFAVGGQVSAFVLPILKSWFGVE